MKQQLLSKIIPIIEAFVDEVLKSFSNLENIRKESIESQRRYEDLCSQKEKEFDDIKRLKASSKAEIDQKITDLENAKTDFTNKIKSYENLYHELAKNKADIESNLNKSSMELVRAKDTRLNAEKIKDDAEKIKKTYEIKMDSLKVDSAKQDEEWRIIREEKVKLKSREEQLFVDETRTSNKAKENADNDLKMKVREQEIQRLVKRYNLGMSLKG